MKSKTLLFSCLAALFSFGTVVSAQDWNAHRQTVLARDGLIRYYRFDDRVAETKSAPNLAANADIEASNFSYKTNHPFEIVDGPIDGSKAARIDAGWFEAAKWSGVDKAFTVGMRIRKLGQGAERGNSGSTNGTLFGLGNGWDNGIRLTTSYPQRNLVFSIGRATDEKSRNLVGKSVVPDGVWQHVAAVWDGKTMRLYVDGLLYGITDYEGGLTDPGWGFRVGFNDAGVGSVKMDVAEVAVYRSALAPEEILQHALLQPKFPEKHAALYHSAIEAVFRKDYAAASKEIDALLELKMPDVYRFTFRRFQIDLAAMSGNRTRSQRLSAEMLGDPNLPKHFETILLRSLLTSDFSAPLPAASSVFYRKILDDKSIEMDARQRLAVEKCFAEALFVEGKTGEAKKALDALRGREAELLHETLELLGVSSDFSKLYLNYREEQKKLRNEIDSYLKGLSAKSPKETKAWLETEFSEPARKLTTLYLLDDLKKDFGDGEDYFKTLGHMIRHSDSWISDFDVSKTSGLTPLAHFYVAPDGKADNPGTKEQPFGSLQQARDALRKSRAENTLPWGGAYVHVLGGVYPVTETFVLEKQDSGTDGGSIMYDAYGDEKPVFTGGVSVKDFKKVDDPAVLKRLPEEARDKVFVALIPENVEFPPVEPRGYGKNGLGAAPFSELFIDDRPQQIARWPNFAKPDAPDPLKASEAAFAKTGKVHRGQFRTPEANKPGIFEYADPRHERWTEAKDAMLFGYWGHLWGITSCRIEKIDTEKKQVVLATNNPYGYRENMPYYAFNLLEEIDEPGEWYLDRENKKLYVYPPEDVDPNAAKVRLPAFAKNFFELKNVSNVAFVGLAFEEGAANAGLVQGGDNVLFAGCRFDRFGNWGLGVDGKKIRVQSCDFTALGGGGINLRGGDVKTLSPGGNVIENCTVHDFSRVDRAYAPAVLIDGVGNRIAHGLFCDSPGHALRVEGMEHTIEFNEVHSIVYESDDQSGIDIWGNPFIRGMVFRYNYWHHIGSGRDVAGQAGIRLDDMISGVLIYGNVFFRSSGGHFGGVQIHGGKDNIVDGNLMIDCKYAVSFSPWGEKRWLEMLDRLGNRAKGQGFDPEAEVYRTKYPDYAELKLNADRNFVTRNIAIGCDEFARNSRRNVLLENLMLPWMPDLFPETRGMRKPDADRVPTDARKVRRRLSIPADSSVYRLIGIDPLPVELMGPYVDAFRKELPRTEITPYFVLE